MLVLLVKSLAAYLLGSVSGSLLLGRLRGFDIRLAGSGNAGGTNALRTRGWRFALAVVLIDVGKGALAAALCLLVLPPASAATATVHALCGAFAAMLGHVWPLYYGFRGGKGAATLIGAVGVLQPSLLLPLVMIWLLLLGSLGYVGLATVVAALAFPLLVVAVLPPNPPLLLFATASALLLLWTHRSNLDRLRRGTEHRFERARVLTRWLRPGR